MTFTRALAVEGLGIALVAICSLVTLPIVSSQEGTVTTVQMSDASSYELNMDVYSPDSLGPVEWGFEVNGPTKPAGPGPTGGQAVRVDYIETTHGWTVLSVVVGPDAPGSTTYRTPDGVVYDQQQPIHWAAAAGLLAGLVLAAAGAVLLFSAGRRLEAPRGGLAVALAAVTVLGGVGLAGMWFDPYMLSVNVSALTWLWLISAVIALAVAIAGRHEGRPYARRALAFTSLTSGLWIVWWIGSLVHMFSGMS